MWRETPAASAEPTTTSANGPIGDKNQDAKKDEHYSAAVG